MICKSAGIIPVRFTDKTPYFLMLRAYHYWDFPKGRLEKGEDVLSAALRELKEESGINNIVFTWGKVSISTKPYKTKVDGKNAKKVATYFVAEALSNAVEIKPNPSTGRLEHEEFRWMTYDEINSTIKLSNRIEKVLDWANKIIGE